MISNCCFYCILLIICTPVAVFSLNKYEKDAINAGKNASYVSFSEVNNTNTRKRSANNILCATFMKTTKKSLKNLYSNIATVGDECDWAILVYGGTKEAEQSLCKNETIQNRILYCNRSTFSNWRINFTQISDLLDFDHVDVNILKSYVSDKKISKIKHLTKTVMYHELLPLLTNYQKIFLIDEDISLSIPSFNLTASLLIWDCSFSRPPLIAQPLINQKGSQYYRFLNYKSWSGKNITSAAVGLIEQQAPMFDTRFFRWFVSEVMIHTKVYALIYQADWGHDRTWCKAARMYGREVLGWRGYQHSCILLVGSNPVYHLNANSISTKHKDPNTFRKAGMIVVRKYTSLFPSWVERDVVSGTDPLNPKNKKRYPKIKTLNSSFCPSSRLLL